MPDHDTRPGFHCGLRHRLFIHGQFRGLMHEALVETRNDDVGAPLRRLDVRLHRLDACPASGM